MMDELTHGQLWAGIGGFGLAAEWAVFINLWANEIDGWCCSKLKKNFPNTAIYEKDIKELGKHNLPYVDVISGGFPCQPFSHAGKRKGTDDNRYLWPQNFRIIQELKPPWFIGENVAGLLSMAQPIREFTVEGTAHLSTSEKEVTVQRAERYVLDIIIKDLESAGYEVQLFLIQAAACGAWHKRDRIWIIAHTSSKSRRKKTKGRMEMEQNALYRPKRKENTNRSRKICTNVSDINQSKCQQSMGRSQPKGGTGFTNKSKDAFNSIGKRGRSRNTKGQNAKNVGELRGSPQYGYWDAEPNVGRVANGVPDRVAKLKGLGNAIVPQVAYPFFKMIKELHSY